MDQCSKPACPLDKWLSNFACLVKSQFTFYLIDRLAWALANWATRDNERVLAQLENLLIQDNWTTLLSP